MLSDMDFEGPLIRPIRTGSATAMPAITSQLAVDLTPIRIPAATMAVTHKVAATALIAVNCMFTTLPAAAVRCCPQLHTDRSTRANGSTGRCAIRH